jgi:hypothetical protein
MNGSISAEVAWDIVREGRGIKPNSKHDLGDLVYQDR